MKNIKRYVAMNVLILLIVGIITTNVASAMVIADLDGVDDGYTKVTTINYDRFVIFNIESTGAERSYTFFVDKRLENITRNLGSDYYTISTRRGPWAGYPNDIIVTVRGEVFYSMYINDIAKTFSVGINDAQEALINSEIAKDPTLANKVKIEVVTTEATPEL